MLTPFSFRKVKKGAKAFQLTLKNHIWNMAEDKCTGCMSADIQLNLEIWLDVSHYTSVAAQLRGACRQIQDMTLLVPAVSTAANTRIRASSMDIFHLEDRTPFLTHPCVVKLDNGFVKSMCTEPWQTFMTHYSVDIIKSTFQAPWIYTLCPQIMHTSYFH